MAEAFAILRTKKLKTPGNVAGAASHIERSRPTANANPDIANEWLQGGPGMYAKAKEIWESIPKKRSDAVHAFEVLLSASPEAFADGMSVDDWKAQSMEWLRNQFHGAEIVGACLHLDESTPHIQAIIVPTDKKPDGTRQLNCKKYLGSAAKLSAMQTSYARAVQGLGLQRGLQGSKAKHTHISQFYGELRQASRVKLERPTVATPPLILSVKGRAAWALEQSSRLQKALAGPITAMRGEIASGHIAYRQNRQLKSANSALSKRLADNLEEGVRQQLRLLPLNIVALSLGCYQTPESRSKDSKQWITPVGKINIDASQFYNHTTGYGHGGAISLVMHVNGCTADEATAYLRDQFDSDKAIEAAAEHARITAREVVAKAPPATFKAPEHDPQSWGMVRDYLVRGRALAARLVDLLQERGWIRAEWRSALISNAVFMKTDNSGIITSAEVRGIWTSEFKQSRGRTSEGIFPLMIEGSTKLAVCESAIDAISYVQTHPGSSAIATCGTGKWACAKTFLDRFGSRFKEVVCASDNGAGGEGMAKALGLPYEPPPRGFDDWNDFARAVAARADLMQLIEAPPVVPIRLSPRKSSERRSGEDFEPN